MSPLRTTGIARPRPFGPGTVRPRRHYGDPPIAEGTSSWSSAELTGAELAARQKGYPVIVAAHALRDAFLDQASPVARWSSDGTTGGSDDTDPDHPAARAYDGHGHRVTKPLGANTNSRYVVDFGEGNEQTFDAVYIAGDNLEDADTVVGIAIADDGSFTSPTFFVGFTPGGTYGRGTGPVANVMASAFLGHTGTEPRRYSGVRFLVLVVVSTAKLQPRLTELWLGRSYQLPRHFDTPQSDRREESAVSGDDSPRAGLTARRTRRSGGAYLPVSLTLNGDDEAGEARDYWWIPSHEGGEPVVLITGPYTDAQGRLMRMRSGPEFDPVDEGPNARPLGVELVEMAPFAGDL